jgi:hypothetical protein
MRGQVGGGGVKHSFISMSAPVEHWSVFVINILYSVDQVAWTRPGVVERSSSGGLTMPDGSRINPTLPSVGS